MLIRKLNFLYKRSLNVCYSILPASQPENITTEINRDDLFSKPLQYPDYFKVGNLFTVKDLFDAKVHYGHKVTSLNNKMKPFIFGSRLGHIIFDLDITAFHLREALNFTAHVAFRDGVILFVSRNPSVTLLVEKTALECKEFAVTRQWKEGLFTNSEEIFKRVIRLPDMCIMLNTLEENGIVHNAVFECARLCIPTVAIVDSNCDPNLISYPVPGNDDSHSSIQLYCNLFKSAIMRGKEERRKVLEHQASKESQLLTKSSEMTKVAENKGK